MSTSLSARSGRAFVTVMAGVVAVAVAGCGEEGTGSGSDTGSGSNGGSRAPAKILVMNSTTGQFAAAGQLFDQGYKLAETYINENEGVLGQDLEIEYVDDAGDPAQSSTLLREACESQDVVGVVGPISTTQFLAIAPLAEQCGIPLLSPGAAGPLEKSQMNEWTFRNSVTTSMSIGPTYEYMATELDPQPESISFIADQTNEALSSECAAGKEEAEANGLTVAGEVSARGTDTEFGAQIAQLQSSGADLIHVCLNLSSLGAFAQQAQARGLDTQMVGFGGPSQLGGQQAAGEALNGCITQLPFDVDNLSPVGAELAEEYEAQHNTPIGEPSAKAFDGIFIMADAINRAGSTDRQEVRDALGSTEGLVGAANTYTFDDFGDNTTPSFSIARITGVGQYEVLQAVES